MQEASQGKHYQLIAVMKEKQNYLFLCQKTKQCDNHYNKCDKIAQVGINSVCPGLVLNEKQLTSENVVLEEWMVENFGFERKYNNNYMKFIFCANWQKQFLRKTKPNPWINIIVMEKNQQCMCRGEFEL